MRFAQGAIQGERGLGTGLTCTIGTWQSRSSVFRSVSRQGIPALGVPDRQRHRLAHACTICLAQTNTRNRGLEKRKIVVGSDVISTLDPRGQAVVAEIAKV